MYISSVHFWDFIESRVSKHINWCSLKDHGCQKVSTLKMLSTVLICTKFQKTKIIFKKLTKAQFRNNSVWSESKYRQLLLTTYYVCTYGKHTGVIILIKLP